MRKKKSPKKQTKWENWVLAVFIFISPRSAFTHAKRTHPQAHTRTETQPHYSRCCVLISVGSGVSGGACGVGWGERHRLIHRHGEVIKLRCKCNWNVIVPPLVLFSFLLLVSLILSLAPAAARSQKE